MMFRHLFMVPHHPSCFYSETFNLSQTIFTPGCRLIVSLSMLLKLNLFGLAPLSSSKSLILFFFLKSFHFSLFHLVFEIWVLHLTVHLLLAITFLVSHAPPTFI